MKKAKLKQLRKLIQDEIEKTREEKRIEKDKKYPPKENSKRYKELKKKSRKKLVD